MIGVSPSPNGVVRSFLHLAILHVHVRDARVVLLEERHRRRVVAGDEVPEIEVRPVVARLLERRLPVLRASSPRGRDRPTGSLCLSANWPMRSVCLASISHEMRARAQRAREREAVIHLVVRHGVDAVVFDDLDQHAGVFVLLAERRDAIHRDRRAPLPHHVGRRLSDRSRPATRENFSTGCDRISTALTFSFRHAIEQLVRVHVAAAEVVRHVQADLHAGELRIRLRRALRRSAELGAAGLCRARRAPPRESPPPQAFRGRAVSVS